MAVPTLAETTITPKSTHLSDAALQPFLHPGFDAADYLNTTLPSLSLSSVSSRPLKQSHAVSLADLSSQTQDLLSQLNAHTNRLSTILTQLTDDILRSGGRLAYEVEVLRGETIGLTETLTTDLFPSIKKFLPKGITLEEPVPTTPTEDVQPPPTTTTDLPPTKEANTKAEAEADLNPPTPPYLTSLRTLTLIRTRLDAVIRVFGEAMQWTLPPSEISLTSSLISVSAPDPSSDHASREQKGRAFSDALRAEISDLITGEEGDGEGGGAEAAMVRIQALRDLALVWKGTAEEKARVKFVEGLVKVAEERVKSVREAAQRQKGGRRQSVRKEPAVSQKGGGGGFLDNLQRLL
ncbi:hypothetical protein P154DRAFT_80582 [Amniculicola lignicola CBS 123094]|uniref:Uncharacterized protein n=1 Tax=Amniculicola lignicola CBS 123094 TaxID=1392246 RepID=A0A6A5WP69_9PLEO|nr:hypothetical protein P154DRAFT_80582 [Amniculicola lignicola CBS 123094]